MDARERLVGRCAADIPGESREVAVNVGALLRRVLLFDEYILESIRLKEIPHLIRTLGYEETLTLLDSNVLGIHHFPSTIGQTGQLAVLESRLRKGLLPLGSYSFSAISAADYEQHLNKCVEEIRETMSLTADKAAELSQKVRQTLVSPSDRPAREAVQQLQDDLAGNSPICSAAVSALLTERTSQRVEPGAFNLKVEAISEGDFRVETNVGDRYGLSKEDVHKLVERALLGVGGLNQRFGLMKEYEATTGLRDQDLVLLDWKLRLLYERGSPGHQEDRLTRLIELTSLPTFPDKPSPGDIDVARLLKLRETDEYREFRRWLRETDSLSDNEIEKLSRDLSERFSRAFHGSIGKAFRFLATTVAGAVPVAGPILGAGLEAIDTFVLERLVREPGPVSFLSQQYKSIFEPS